MTQSIVAWLVVYALLLIGATMKATRRQRKSDAEREARDGAVMTGRAQDEKAAEFIFASGNVGPWLTGLGMAATLFSAFTLVGMPDFFRAHGIGAWLFLGVTDVALAAILLYVGLHFRRALSSSDKTSPSVTSFLIAGRAGKLAGWVYVVATTLFLLPYMTIQIKGPSLLLQNTLPIPGGAPMWSAVIVGVILAYASFGGIKAVFTTDFVQGIALIIVAFAAGGAVVWAAGGFEALFTQARAVDPRLLSTPGPAGLLTVQFLLISFISICAMPYAQPQLATRVLIAKDDETFRRSAAFLGLFAFVVILPTIVLGMRLIHHGGGGAAALLALLRNDLPPLLAGAFVMAVLAASMSTIDSQLFALGTEWSAAFGGGRASPRAVKIIGGIVAVVVMVLSQASVGSIVLFSVNSFIGTSLLVPLLVAGVTQSANARKTLIAVAIVSAVCFILALAGVIPSSIGPLRIELCLYAIEGLTIGGVVMAARSGVGARLEPVGT